MPKEDEPYCRLCAEPTPEQQLIQSNDDVAISSKIATKMLWINIDVSSNNYLPKAICFSCFDLLEKTWSFLHNTRTAQQKLNGIYSRRLQLPPPCKAETVKPNEAGKPVNKNWEEFQEIKDEVKVEVNLDNIATVDPSSLLRYPLDENVKIECPSDDNTDNRDEVRSSDSDMPLLKAVKWKRTKKLKKKKKKKVKFEEEIDVAELLPNPEAEVIPLDMSHYNRSWEDYAWRCANCDAQCKSVMSLRLHSLEIHSSCCIFRCSDCDRVITNYKAFLSHVRLHHKSLQYCCEYCNKHFTMTNYLKKHKNTVHTDMLMSCQNCGTMFDSPEQLQDHILMFAKGYRRQAQRKREVIEKDLKCELCNKDFKTASNLRAHKLVHTERSRDFSCHVCGKMFFTKGALSTHMSVHEDAKPYKCEYCNMAFRARGNLISHISLHSNAKPFVCEQCGKSFRVKRHLKSHSIVHTDLMPYVCQYCNKSFRFKTRLNLHLRQHTGSKPYTCLYCQRDFTNGSNFKKHMKRRHNIDTSRKKYPDLVTLESQSVALEITVSSTMH